MKNTLILTVLSTTRSLKNSLLTVFLISILASCKKQSDDIQLQFPIQLALAEINAKQPIRMYVGNREILDTNIISNFTRRASIFKLLQTEAKLENSLTFVSPDSSYFLFEPNTFKVRKEQDVILFTEKSPRIITIYDYNSFWKISKYREQFTQDSLQTGFVKTSSIRAATGDYEDLQIYVLGILLNREDYPGFGGELGVQGHSINRFDGEYLKSLGPKDTLAFKEISYRYRKIK